MIGHTQGHGWCDPQGFMDPAEIVVAHVQGHGCLMVFQLFAETVGQPGKSALRHSEAQVLPLDVTGADLPAIWITSDLGMAYLYYPAGRISPCCILRRLAFVDFD